MNFFNIERNSQVTNCSQMLKFFNEANESMQQGLIFQQGIILFQVEDIKYKVHKNLLKHSKKHHKVIMQLTYKKQEAE